LHPLDQRWSWRNNNLQSSKSQDTRNHNLGLAFHLQLPDDKEGQDTKRPVGHGIKHRNDVRVDNDDFRRDALAMVIGVKVPPEVNGFALEGDEKTVRNGEDDVANHDGADNPDVSAVDGDTKQEKANADFEGCGCERVRDFAEEPVLLVGTSVSLIGS
jgi:hypothetical protein